MDHMCPWTGSAVQPQHAHGLQDAWTAANQVYTCQEQRCPRNFDARLYVSKRQHDLSHGGDFGACIFCELACMLSSMNGTRRSTCILKLKLAEEASGSNSVSSCRPHTHLGHGMIQLEGDSGTTEAWDALNSTLPSTWLLSNPHNLRHLGALLHADWPTRHDCLQ